MFKFEKQKRAPVETTRNPFKRPMNPLQKQWYRVLVARKIGFGGLPITRIDQDVSYATVCRRRYNDAFERYNEQFRKEIDQLVLMQPNAIDAMKVHRNFSVTMLWPPLHSKLEINSTLQKLDKVLTVQERRRLEEILRYKK